MTGPRRDQGFSLVELVVAVLILSLVILGLVASSVTAARRAAASGDDLIRWAETRSVADSLWARGWGKLTSGSRDGPIPMRWDVDRTSPTLDRVILIAGPAPRSQAVDTLALVLARP